MPENKFFADNDHVRPLGRTLFIDNVRYLGWSCSGIELSFTGTELSAEIRTDWLPDEPWKVGWQPYIGVFADGDKVPRRIGIEAGTKRYTLFKSEAVRTVKIRVVKLSENAFGKLGISGLFGDGEASPTEAEAPKIEFIGDSITCGFGIEGKSAGEGFRTETENPTITYAALTAEALGAEYELISWSGIGVYSCSCPDDAEEPSDQWLMPMIYGFTDAGTEDSLGLTGRTLWDFSVSVPKIIVVNLGTNDYIFTKEIPERKESFRRAYGEFLRLLREKNPSVPILCTMGMMGGELYPEIEAAVRDAGDGGIFSMRLTEQRSEDGIGSEGHPNAVTHRKAAAELTERIKRLAAGS